MIGVVLFAVIVGSFSTGPVAWPLHVASWPVHVASWPLHVASWPLHVASWPLHVAPHGRCMLECCAVVVVVID
jgi:hypothetical protein